RRPATAASRGGTRPGCGSRGGHPGRARRGHRQRRHRRPAALRRPDHRRARRSGAARRITLGGSRARRPMTAGPGHVVVHPSVLYVGTPAYLISTLNPDGTANLAPASSYWALGQMLVLGIEAGGQTIENLLARDELTVNFPSGEQWRSVVRLAPLTGRDPVPEAKAARYRFEPRKFKTAGLTPQRSELVSPPRVLECALQLEE